MREAEQSASRTAKQPRNITPKRTLGKGLARLWEQPYNRHCDVHARRTARRSQVGHSGSVGFEDGLPDYRGRRRAVLGGGQRDAPQRPGRRAGGTVANDSAASVRVATVTTQMLQYARDRGVAAAGQLRAARAPAGRHRPRAVVQPTASNGNVRETPWNARYHELDAFRNSWFVGYWGSAPSLLQHISHSNVPQSQGYLGGWVYHQQTDSWV